MAELISGIDHVQLAIPKGGEAAARAFYGGILALSELEKPESLRKRGGVWFDCGDQELHLGIQEPFSPASKAHPAFRVYDLEAIKLVVAQNGIMVKTQPPIPGADRIFIDDPFGNRIELIER